MMKTFWFIIGAHLFSYFYHNFSAESHNFCEVRLNHVLCDYYSTRYSPECGDYNDIQEHPPSPSEINEILQTHNHFRNQVASGNYVYFDPLKPLLPSEERLVKPLFPSASNLNELSYSYELQNLTTNRIASCNNRVLYDDKGKVCLPCFKTVKYQAMEAFSAFEGYSAAIRYESWTSMIEDLYERSFDDLSPTTTNPNFDAQKLGEDQYTILLSAEVTEVGCNRITYFRLDFVHVMLFTCVYAPLDLGKKKLYQPGNSCSNCSPCSPIFLHLCRNKNHANFIEKFPTAIRNVDISNVDKRRNKNTYNLAMKPSTSHSLMIVNGVLIMSSVFNIYPV